MITKQGKSVIWGWNLIQSLDLFTAIRSENESVNEVEDSAIGCVKNFVHKVRVRDNVQPVRQPLRPVPFALRDKVKSELHRLLNDQIIEPVDASPWISNLVIAVKPTGRVRLCVDLRQVNKAVIANSFPLPRIDEVFHKTNGSKVFSKIDLSDAYLQLPLAEESRNLTAFTSHEGIFRYRRVCFGLASAPSAFQAMMETIFKEMSGIIVYIDDIIIHTFTAEEHDLRLKEVISKLAEAGLKINFQKSEFRKDSIEYLGHCISADGVKPAKSKINALISSALPTTIAELRTMLGAFGFFSRFIHAYSDLVEPLRVMVRDNNLHWDPTSLAAVKQLKHAIATCTALIPYSLELPVVVSTDASGVGLGATLSHVFPDGTTRVIEFASRTLSCAERKYSTTEREALAIVWACERWRTY